MLPIINRSPHLFNYYFEERTRGKIRVATRPDACLKILSEVVD